ARVYYAPSEARNGRRVDRRTTTTMGGKKGGSDGLGRALIKQHNQMVRESKEKGRALRLEQRRVLESVTEVSDIDAILEKAAEADRVYSFDNPSPHVLINLYDTKLVMVVDARDPLFYRCPDLEVSATAALEGKQLIGQFEEERVSKELIQSDLDTKIYSRDELLARLQSEAEAIAAYRRFTDKESHSGKHSETSSINPTAKQVVVGFVGYPNVGKSSTINALVGQKRTGVTSTPGKTKHFQTLIISDELVLCDCPGLVFPSFSSSRYEMIASGVLPIDRMSEHREAVQVVANRVPRNVLESVYNITLPKPKAYEAQSRPPLSSELLRTYCSSRGYVSSSGLPDETRATRQILKDYVDGKLPHFELPPGADNEDVEVNATDVVEDPNSLTDNEPDACDSDEATMSDIAGVEAQDHALSNALNDLESFDLASELSSKKAAAAKKKSSDSTHKHHKKPQRKKDRSWRVGNDDGDGMPVVRVFQRPAVNLADIGASNR
ncbi:hypothetical protein BHE74_00006821, partial [Ensete ventricosum]